METEYWHETITEKSWNALLELVRLREFKFVVIGGWAVYLHTKALKSKDIDMILENWGELGKLKKFYALRKNERLGKYEFFKGDIEIDIYAPGFSKLAIPCEELAKMSNIVDGIRTLNPEPLIILKQEAESSRSGSVKGEKDRADILSLLSFCEINFPVYKELVLNYNLVNYPKMLRQLIESERAIMEKFFKNPAELKKRKTAWIKELKQIEKVVTQEK